MLAILLAIGAAGDARAADLRLGQSTPMRFGDFVALGEGAVTLPARGFPAYHNATGAGAAPAPAIYSLTGEPLALIDIQLPRTTVELRLAVGFARLRNFTLEPLDGGEFVDLGGGRYRVRLGQDGAASFTVGATLAFSDQRTAGAGGVSYTISAQYVE